MASGDLKAKASGMIQSLVTQLLLYDLPWDLGYLERRHVDKLEQGDLEALCQTLRELFQQLPTNSLVFMMIDGITYYERQPKRRQFLEAVESIMYIVDERDDLVVKLLLTCHGRSVFIKPLVQVEDVLLVPSVIDGDEQVWSNRAWDRIISTEMKDHVDEVSDGDSEERVKYSQ